jgi:hypothetical protein
MQLFAPARQHGLAQPTTITLHAASELCGPPYMSEQVGDNVNPDTQGLTIVKNSCRYPQNNSKKFE